MWEKISSLDACELVTVCEYEMITPGKDAFIVETRCCMRLHLREFRCFGNSAGIVVFLFPFPLPFPTFEDHSARNDFILTKNISYTDNVVFNQNSDRNVYFFIVHICYL